MQTATIEVTGLLSALSARGIEKKLLRLPGIHTAAVNYVAGSATVAYDETATDLQAIETGVRVCGYHCAGAQLPRHLCAPEERLAAGRAHEAHAATADAMAHEMGHGAGMDMQAMARDMRNRFLIATAFTVPVFVYSPMGGMFTPPAPPFDLPLNVWLFLLASVAVLYPVWPFVVAAWRALKNGVLNMAVLVVMSVGTGYLFSVGATFFFTGVQFYEAVAVLLVFILLGHWLEMRARAGASAAIRTLLDLAPPMAMVIRDGHETQLPT
ncbi:MAG: heavy metal translocating P-type ATPase, partial [Desulfobacterales bacterium]|nr:heavy metal translocating P-type ATPase [Desulfobacterales bacterium]